MIILIHVVSALLSLILASYGAVRPSRKLLRITYGLAASTLLSGIYVSTTNTAHMGQACLSGLVYFGAMTVLIHRAQRTLVHERIRNE